MQTILTLHLTDPCPNDWDESTYGSTTYLLYKNMLKRIDLLPISQVDELYNALLDCYKSCDPKGTFMRMNVSSLLEQYYDELSVRIYNEGMAYNERKRTRSGKTY
jgi:hypothetical protein